MPRVLRNLRISEVSAVDCGAGDGTTIMLRKRSDDRLAHFRKIFSGRRSQRDISKEANRDFQSLHPVAKWLVEKSGGELDIVDVLCWLDEHYLKNASAPKRKGGAFETVLEGDEATGTVEHHASKESAGRGQRRPA